MKVTTFPSKLLPSGLIHGGHGFLKGSSVERLYRDAKLGEIGEGTSEMQRRTIAGSLLGNGD